MYTATHTIRIAALTREHPREVLVRRVVIAFLIATAALYAILISASVLHVIARKEATSNMVAVAANIASLEQQYFSLSSIVKADKATDMGLVSLSDKDFVTRTVHLGLSTGDPLRQ